MKLSSNSFLFLEKMSKIEVKYDYTNEVKTMKYTDFEKTLLDEFLKGFYYAKSIPIRDAFFIFRYYCEYHRQEFHQPFLIEVKYDYTNEVKTMKYTDFEKDIADFDNGRYEARLKKFAFLLTVSQSAFGFQPRL